MKEKTKNEVKSWLQNQVNFLEENRTLELLENKEIAKIELLKNKIDYTILDIYFCDEMISLDLGSTEIKGSPVLLALLISWSSHGDYQFFKDYHDFEKILKEKGGDIGFGIAEKMPTHYLRELEIKEFCINNN